MKSPLTPLPSPLVIKPCSELVTHAGLLNLISLLRLRLRSPAVHPLPNAANASPLLCSNSTLSILFSSHSSDPPKTAGEALKCFLSTVPCNPISKCGHGTLRPGICPSPTGQNCLSTALPQRGRHSPLPPCPIPTHTPAPPQHCPYPATFQKHTIPPIDYGSYLEYRCRLPIHHLSNPHTFCKPQLACTFSAKARVSLLSSSLPAPGHTCLLISPLPQKTDVLQPIQAHGGPHPHRRP